MNDEKIAEKIRELIEEGYELKKDLVSHTDDYNQFKNRYKILEGQRWKGKCLNLLKLRFGVESDYFKDFDRAINTRWRHAEEYCEENVSKAIGVLEYVYDALINDLTEDLFFKKEVLVMSNLLDQAYEFLNKGFKHAAAIYGRIILETTIKEYAKLSGIDDEKFDQVIIHLRKKDLIHKPFENSLRANYEIGSWAVHNDEKFNRLSYSEIKEFLNFIRDKVLNIV